VRDVGAAEEHGRGRAAREGFAAARGWWLGWLQNFVEGGSLGKIGRF